MDNYLHKNPRMRATIKRDMTYPMSSTHYNSCGLVIDSGTGEHVFNFTQVLMNISQCPKTNGFVCQTIPANGWLELKKNLNRWGGIHMMQQLQQIGRIARTD